ncbi:GNAT superfamily N-acetyltransferase [Arthrobacter pascens]|uniref:GNAT family N-acetyltransferase n=1 Tax=Arthrobacter pascens TaxID=1677 RepID=UPI002793C687|nr:GNAT family N-acetyltransferase [Arthrobacter pascens]MDQ0676669.1 GNAT superfamily N-acetyltransferase [Arthrobacter pascens]
MPDSVSSRPALALDVDQVWPLVRDFATSFQPERRAFERTFGSLIEDPRALVLVAEQSATNIVGYLLAHSQSTFFANGPVVWIEEVMVAGGIRRNGVGRALMTAAETWAGLQGAAYVSLASRRAGDFYRAMGYEDSATFFKKSLSSGIVAGDGPSLRDRPSI